MVLVIKNPPAKAGDTRDAGSIPGMGRSAGVGNGNLLQYSCLENSNGQRSQAGYSPWDCKELDTTEQLSVHVCACARACVHTLTHTISSRPETREVQREREKWAGEN